MFGSTARGEDRRNSDLDLVVTMPPGTTLGDIARWETELRRLAGGVRVELVPDGPEFDRLGSAASDAVAL